MKSPLNFTNAASLPGGETVKVSLNPAHRAIRLGLIAQYLEDVCGRGPGLKTLDDVVEICVRKAVFRLIDDQIHARSLVLRNGGQGIRSDNSLVDTNHTPSP